MKIYTSYYGNLKKLIDDNIVPVIASTSYPKISQLVYIGSDLAPGWEIINNHKNSVKNGSDPNPILTYTNDYIKKLDKISLERWKKIYNDLTDICIYKNSDSIALMCYESPDKFCHRHILANYINKGFFKYIAIDNLFKKGVTEYNSSSPQLCDKYICKKLF